MTPRRRRWFLSIFAATLTVLAASGSAAQTPDGKLVFETHCQKCHGPAGRPSAGIKKLLPEIPLWDAAFFAKRSEEDILNVLRNGKGKNMKPFSDRLKPEEMVAVARYIRTLTP
jgi:mono/diheme cytochrome c family protein